MITRAFAVKLIAPLSGQCFIFVRAALEHTFVVSGVNTFLSWQSALAHSARCMQRGLTDGER